jgi:flagellar capping protein FliD
MTATAGRTAVAGKQAFTVEQLAKGDRFLSTPLAQDVSVPSGSYGWEVGPDGKAGKVSLDFKGGSLGDFVKAANAAGQATVKFSTISVTEGTQSLLVECQKTGKGNNLDFSNAATGQLAVKLGLGQWPGNADNQYEAFIPSNVLSKAQDAKISMDGIEITRPDNTMSDVVPGISLVLHDTSSKPVVITVTGDTDSVKNGIITLVGNYNQLMAEINVLTRKDDTIITELTYLTADQKKDYEAKLGTMMGDSTLNAIRSSLQNASSAPYKTSDPKLTMLAQIGISTNTSKGGGYDASKLRGYLEIDESVLDNALANNMDAVKQLFARDNNGDLIADAGYAWTIDADMKPYVQVGGIVSLKTDNIDKQIKDDNDRISTLNTQLDAKKQQLKEKYSQMDSAWNQMQQMTQQLSGLDNNNNK